MCYLFPYFIFYIAFSLQPATHCLAWGALILQCQMTLLLNIKPCCPIMHQAFVFRKPTTWRWKTTGKSLLLSVWKDRKGHIRKASGNVGKRRGRESESTQYHTTPFCRVSSTSSRLPTTKRFYSISSLLFLSDPYYHFFTYFLGWKRRSSWGSQQIMKDRW